MPPSSQYQRVLIKNVPSWKDIHGNLYYYESSTPPTEESRILIGIEATGFNTDWSHHLDPTLKAYRVSQKPRARAPSKN